MQLKHREIKEHRAKQLKRQRGICPLCNTPILEGEDTLDHCHDSGHVRAVLHRSCNSAEGKIKQWAGPRSRGDDPQDFLRRTLRYWNKDYSQNPLHPTHGKPRRRKRRAKRKRS